MTTIRLILGLGLLAAGGLLAGGGDVLLSETADGWQVCAAAPPPNQPVGKPELREDEQDKVDGKPSLAAEVEGPTGGLGFMFTRKLQVDDPLSRFQTVSFSYKVKTKEGTEGKVQCGVRLTLPEGFVQHMLPLEADGEWHEAEITLAQVTATPAQASREQIPNQFWISLHFKARATVSAKTRKAAPATTDSGKIRRYDVPTRSRMT